jgi:NTE family protein
VTDSTPLDSPAIGTSSTDLVEPCANQEPRAAYPPAPPKQPPFALAFSGGGFRASLGALGVLRFLADAGLLGQVRWVSSVSGGSILNGAFAVAYPDIESAGFTPEALENHLVKPFVDRISSASMQKSLAGGLWKIVGRRTRTDVLAEKIDDWFFSGRLLEDIPPECRFIFNASNLTTGVRFGFERDVFGDYVMGRRPTAGSGLRLAQAAAASASFPGAFAPVVLSQFTFPCSNGRTATLLDGGTYDNMGLEPLDDLNRPSSPEHLRDACLVVANAGGVFRASGFGGLPFLKNLQRTNSLLYRQSVVLRTRSMVERFQAWETAPAGEKPPWARRGVLFGLATTMREGDAAEWCETRPEPSKDAIVALARTPTTLDLFPQQLCERLMYRGWWLTGATLSQYHRELLPAELPTRPDPGA